MPTRRTAAHLSDRTRLMTSVGTILVVLALALATEPPTGSTVDVTPDGTTTVPVGDTVTYSATCTCGGEGTHNLHWTHAWSVLTNQSGDSDGSDGAISKSGKANSPGIYTISASCDATTPAHGDDDETLEIVKVDKLQKRLSAAGAYQDWTSAIKVLKGITLYAKAVKSPEAANWPAGKPVWAGTFGITGNGETASGACTTASTSDTDFKTVTGECGNVITANALVCDTVLGVHSNVGPGDGPLDGHAWITYFDYSTTPATTMSYGLWPDDHPDYLPGGDNGPGWDIRTGRESSSSSYQRFYVLTPSQKATLASCIAANVTWSYTNNCSSWASDTGYALTGEDVDADDERLLGVESPSEFGSSIQELEATDPTSSNNPAGNGDDIGGGSSSSSSW